MGVADLLHRDRTGADFEKRLAAADADGAVPAGGREEAAEIAGHGRRRWSTWSTASYRAPLRAWSSPYDAMARAYQWPHSYSLKGLRVRPS